MTKTMNKELHPRNDVARLCFQGKWWKRTYQMCEE